MSVEGGKLGEQSHSPSGVSSLGLRNDGGRGAWEVGREGGARKKRRGEIEKQLKKVKVTEKRERERENERESAQRCRK